MGLWPQPWEARSSDQKQDGPMAVLLTLLPRPEATRVVQRTIERVQDRGLTLVHAQRRTEGTDTLQRQKIDHPSLQTCFAVSPDQTPGSLRLPKLGADIGVEMCCSVCCGVLGTISGL